MGDPHALVVVDGRTFDEWWEEARRTAPAVCDVCGAGWCSVDESSGEIWVGEDQTGAYAEGYSMMLLCGSEDEHGDLSTCRGKWEAELITKRVRWVVEKEAGGAAGRPRQEQGGVCEL
jgi:hypothetical protein